jgi:hypothetical protein
MNLKTRLLKLEEAKKPDICLVHYVPEIDGEDLDETHARYCLERGLKRNEIVILSYAADLDA